eukprot:1853065-Amphidinium_carterae.1
MERKHLKCWCLPVSVSRPVLASRSVSEWGAGNGIMAATTLFGQWGAAAQLSLLSFRCTIAVAKHDF